MTEVFEYERHASKRPVWQALFNLRFRFVEELLAQRVQLRVDHFCTRADGVQQFKRSDLFAGNKLRQAEAVVLLVFSGEPLGRACEARSGGSHCSNQLSTREHFGSLYHLVPDFIRPVSPPRMARSARDCDAGRCSDDAVPLYRNTCSHFEAWTTC